MCILCFEFETLCSCLRQKQALAAQDWASACEVAERLFKSSTSASQSNISSAHVQQLQDGLITSLFRITEQTQTSLPFVSLCIQQEVARTGTFKI
jgi:hypothetical protein